MWDSMFFQLAFSPDEKKKLFGTHSSGGYKEYQNPGQNTKKSLSSVIETFSLQISSALPYSRNESKAPTLHVTPREDQMGGYSWAIFYTANYSGSGH